MMHGEVNWTLRLVLIGALAVLLVFGGYLWFRPAKVTGATPLARIQSISKVAHDRRMGAGKELARVAREDPVAKVRQAAVMELADFASDDDLLPAALTVSKDQNPAVRATAAYTLAAFDADEAVDRLAEMMISDDSDDVRQAAAAALGKSRSAKAVIPLIQQAEGAPDVDTRVRALRAMAERYGLGSDGLDPRINPRIWNHRVESAKGLPGVEKAFRDHNVPLQRHPEHLIPDPEEH